MERPETIGARIRRLRMEKGLPQAALTGPGVSLSHVSRLESGDRQPSMKALRLLARKLGVTPELLESGIDEDAVRSALLDGELALKLGDVAEADLIFESVIERVGTTPRCAPLATEAEIGRLLVAASRGDHAGVVARFDALGERKPSTRERPDLYAAAGRALSALGDAPQAVALLEACVDELTDSEPCDAAQYVRFATYLSYALTDAGDSARAASVLAKALSAGESLEDWQTQVRVYWALGRLHAQQGPARLALTYYRKALALLEGSEDQLALAGAHECCATALLDDGQTAAAREHLEAAETLYRRLSEERYMGSIRAEWARFFLQLGDYEQAKDAALEALASFDRGVVAAENPAAGWRTLANVLAATGEAELAEGAFRHAIESFGSSRQPRPLSDVYREYAEFLDSRGRRDEAFGLMRRALEVATGVPGEDPGASGSLAGENVRAGPLAE